MTPSGRFEQDVWLCKTLQDFHPDGWQPAWSIAGLLLALLSLMCEDSPAPGVLHPPASDQERRAFAHSSLEWNKGHAEFCSAFPEHAGDKPARPQGGQDRRGKRR